MKIEIFYFEGCPNHQPTVDLVNEIVSSFGVEAEVIEVHVTDPAQTEELKFLGSPSVRVNGFDVEPAARIRTDYGYSCRTYSGAGTPSRAMIENAITGSSSSVVADNVTSENVACDCSAEPELPTSESTRDNNSSVWIAVGTFTTAALASACCWLPLILVGASLSAGGLANFFESTRPVFLALTAGLLALGFYTVYFRKEQCAPGSDCEQPAPRRQRINRAALWMTTIGAALFATFPYYVDSLPLATAQTPPTDGVFEAVALTLPIEGMTCEGCAVTLELALSKTPGVLAAAVDYDQATATLQLDSAARPTENLLAQVIRNSGFAVKSNSQHSPPE